MLSRFSKVLFQGTQSSPIRVNPTTGVPAAAAVDGAESAMAAFSPEGVHGAESVAIVTLGDGEARGKESGPNAQQPTSKEATSVSSCLCERLPVNGSLAEALRTRRIGNLYARLCSRLRDWSRRARPPCLFLPWDVRRGTRMARQGRASLGRGCCRPTSVSGCTSAGWIEPSGNGPVFMSRLQFCPTAPAAGASRGVQVLAVVVLLVTPDVRLEGVANLVVLRLVRVPGRRRRSSPFRRRTACGPGRPATDPALRGGEVLRAVCPLLEADQRLRLEPAIMRRSRRSGTGPAARSSP